MANERIARIREEERSYHERLYREHELFEAGTWLHKPVRTVLDTLNEFSNYGHVDMLDLGCGVGRNSIPMAESLKGRNGSVVCVDLLPSALGKLADYSRRYGVSEYIDPYVADIADFKIEADRYDYIVAVSAIEHVESVAALRSVLADMAAGTRANGINCIIMNTNIEEIDEATGDRLEPLMEANLATEQLERELAVAYSGWETLHTTVKPLVFSIERGGRGILLKGDCLTYVGRRHA